MEQKDDKKENRNRITRADILLAAALLLLAGFGLLFYEKTKVSGKTVRIQTDSETVKTLPLDADAEFEVFAHGGKNTVVIKDGEVHVENADCPDKICEKHKPISAVGETIICLPHRLVVEVTE